MFVVLVVRDGEPDFVQRRRPAEQGAVRPRVELPAAGELREAGAGGLGDAVGLAAVHAVARDKLGDGGIADVVIVNAAQQIVEQALAQGAGRGAHVFKPEGLEHRQQYGEPAGEDGRTLGREAQRRQAADAARGERRFAHPIESLGGNALFAPAVPLE